ncbi:MAG: TrmH family RNA methyltransferase [Pirellulaceae bacterium]|jgi:tRNA G18 (ribose-2'-O)-methylase SpoU|nr:TrmH family RNA methyltransferase [Pirellulaceae bacterium]
MFCTVLHNLKSPTNVGMIVRSHVAFGGREVVFVGYELPWQFKKGSQAFSRRLERLCEIVTLETDDEFFAWARQHRYQTTALEIGEHAVPITTFEPPSHTALIVGNEAAGLSEAVLSRCDFRVFIPQFGRAECLNVAVACSIGMYELTRNSPSMVRMRGGKFAVREVKFGPIAE